MRANGHFFRSPIVLGLCLIGGGCSGVQSALSPHSPEALHLSDLFWIFTIVCGVIWVLVLIGLAIAVARSRARPSPTEPLLLDARGERRRTVVVSSLVALTAVILIGLTTLSYFITRTLASPAPALEVQITGHQWWWEVRYQNDDPSQVLTTANEIHVPVGKAVKFTLEAADVIHSFWVPNLAGKQDLIPGQVNTISFTPKRAGIYRGQCAEFCGLQHANMALLIIAQDQADFESWRADQLHPAVSQSGGEQLFFARGCALCHTIRGTGAGGRLGPDLTHIGSRLTLASGMLRNSRAELSAWLNDPQGLKPGNKMPNIPLQPRETDELVDYLKGLR